MPYPAQVTPERILDRAEHFIEQAGAEQMSLQQLAADLGIKPPSLYRYFSNKADLLRAVNLRTNTALVNAMRDAAAQPADSDSARLLHMGHAYRDYVLAHPQSYLLAYGSPAPALQPDAAHLATLALEIEHIVAPLNTHIDSLTLVRGIWALIHGYVMLELTQQFKRGGDLGATFTQILGIYIDGIRQGHPR